MKPASAGFYFVVINTNVLTTANTIVIIPPINGGHMQPTAAAPEPIAEGAQIGSSGDDARIGSSGNDARINAEGLNAVVVSAGTGTMVRAGELGAIALTWHDGTRARIAVAYVGEGIKADTWYSLNERGEFVEQGESV